MYMNATYKAYVAETAAKIAAAIVNKGSIPMNATMQSLRNDENAEDVAIAALNVAEKLAAKLEEWWTCKGDRSTVMFDPQDSPTSRMEGAMYDIAEKLQDIEAEMERQGKTEY
jgi:hypothetical protein